MVTSSIEVAQVLLVVVQRNVFDAPGVKPVTADVAEFGFAIVPLPETKVQVPVPTAAVVAANVVEVEPHKVWSGPAFAVDGGAAIIIVISSIDAGQGPLVMLHRNVVDVPGVKPVTPDVAELGFVTAPVPETT